MLWEADRKTDFAKIPVGLDVSPVDPFLGIRSVGKAAGFFREEKKLTSLMLGFPEESAVDWPIFNSFQ